MFKKLLLTTLFVASAGASASDISIEMKDLDSGKIVGYVSAEQNEYGVVFTPNLSGLPQGLHGFMSTKILLVIPLKRMVKLF